MCHYLTHAYWINSILVWYFHNKESRVKMNSTESCLTIINLNVKIFGISSRKFDIGFPDFLRSFSLVWTISLGTNRYVYYICSRSYQFMFQRQPNFASFQIVYLPFSLRFVFHFFLPYFFEIKLYTSIGHFEPL